MRVVISQFYSWKQNLHFVRVKAFRKDFTFHIAVIFIVKLPGDLKCRHHLINHLYRMLVRLSLLNAYSEAFKVATYLLYMYANSSLKGLTLELMLGK